MQGRLTKDRNINVQHLQKKFKSNVMSRFYFLFIRRGFPDFCDLFLKNISLTYDIFKLIDFYHCFVDKLIDFYHCFVDKLIDFYHCFVDKLIDFYHCFVDVSSHLYF
jgi:hypothetical protein